MLELNIQLFAVAQHHVSKTRKRKRRSHMALTAPNAIKCPNCGEAIRSHRVCPKCGYYKGKDVINAKKAEEEVKSLKKVTKQTATEKKQPVKEEKKSVKPVKKATKKAETK